MGLCLELCVYVILYVSIYSDLHTTFYVLYGSLYRVFIQPFILYIYVMHKARIRTILGFCCPNLGSELCAIILGSHTQTSDPRMLLRKPRIRTQSSRIAQPNLGHPRQQTHDRSRTQSSLAIRGNVGSLQRMAELLCVRDRSWLLFCRGWPNCFACTIDRGFVDADGRAALRARSIVGLLTRMAGVWLRVAADGRGLVVRSQNIACGSEVYMCDPRIIAQKLGPRFA